MRRRKGDLPLYVTCQRPGCGKLREVRSPHAQRVGKYCSRQCAASVNKNLSKRPDTHAIGLRKGIQTKRRRILARVAGLTPLDAFRLGYRTGLASKCRQLKRLVEEIRAARAAQKAAA